MLSGCTRNPVYGSSAVRAECRSIAAVRFFLSAFLLFLVLRQTDQNKVVDKNCQLGFQLATRNEPNNLKKVGSKDT